MKPKSNIKKERIAKAIRIVWDSLDSHLDDTFNPIYPKLKEKKAKEHIGSQDFHRKCVREYATVIKTLADLL